MMVFLAAETDHWCSVSDFKGINCSTLSWDLTSAECDERKKKFTIPPAADDDDTDYTHNCYRYSNATVESFLSGDVSTSDWPLEACESWDYDTSQYKTTIIHEWDLVCNDKTKPAVSQSVYFGGVLFGSFFFGVLADWIGRKPTLIISIVIQCTFGLAAAFSPSLTVFICLRFVVAAANYGVFLIAFIIGTELVGPSRRTFAGIAIEFFWAFGYMFLAAIAYFIRKWKTLALVISLPGFLSIALYPVIPESVRWLLSQKKVEEAAEIINKAAKVNKVKLPDGIFDEKNFGKEPTSESPKRATAIDLFRTPKMRLKTINLLFNWFVNSMVYYGLSLSTSNLGVDDYIAFLLSGAIEIPAYALSIFTIDYWGRRWNLCGTLVLGGVACLLTILMPLGAWRITVAMIGKFGITASFGIVYIYSAEIYPTPVRSAGIGISSVAARIGGILSPFVLEFESLYEHLPLIIFGSLSIAAGLLVLFLPETNGRQLPETMADGEQFTRTNNGMLSNMTMPSDVQLEIKSGEENEAYKTEEKA
ncbi:organic cation transporter protein-like isoform X2 [Antedon mediterranea]|uniref:organic cation transporter protein-like isoform X2 n=1 Tax=Antedon mediterranea TaxID=105859 RepID=UPI003AF60FEF